MSAQQKPESTAVAVVEQSEKPFALRSPIGRLLSTDERALSIIKPLVPRGVSYDAVIAEVYRAVAANPDIMKCTPFSIIDSVAVVVSSQLVLGKTVYLVPGRVKISKRGEKDEYEDRLQAWFDYRGEIELVMRAGVARLVDAHCVYENEPFDLQLGTNPNVVHRPILDAKKRGELVGGYAYAILPGNLTKIFHMGIADVDAVRANSRSWKYLEATPPWYVRKSTIHRLVHTLPKNPALAKVAELFAREDREDRIDEDLDPANRIETPSVAADSSSEGETMSYELKDRSMPALATQEQKIRIAELLERADVDDNERVRVADIAGKPDYKAKDAIAEIARLEALAAPAETSNG